MDGIVTSFAAFQSRGLDLAVTLTNPGTPTTNTNAETGESRPWQRLRLIVLDSSYNPPTLAHMRMVESAVRDARATTDRPLLVLLLLATNNADKAPKPASFIQRLAMMEILAKELVESVGQVLAAPDRSQPSMACGVDVAVTTKPFFHDKAKAIIDFKHYSESTSPQDQPDMEFLVGYDTLIRILDPKYYPGEGDVDGQTPMQQALGPFFQQASLRVTMRPDASWGGRKQQLAYVEGLADSLPGIGGRSEWAAKITLVEGQQDGEAAVSSSAVREKVRSGAAGGLDGMVSEMVADWIQAEKLYTEDGE